MFNRASLTAQSNKDGSRSKPVKSQRASLVNQQQSSQSSQQQRSRPTAAKTAPPRPNSSITPISIDLASSDDDLVILDNPSLPLPKTPTSSNNTLTNESNADHRSPTKQRAEIIEIDLGDEPVSVDRTDSRLNLSPQLLIEVGNSNDRQATQSPHDAAPNRDNSRTLQSSSPQQPSFNPQTPLNSTHFSPTPTAGTTTATETAETTNVFQKVLPIQRLPILVDITQAYHRIKLSTPDADSILKEGDIPMDVKTHKKSRSSSTPAHATYQPEPMNFLSSPTYSNALLPSIHTSQSNSDSFDDIQAYHRPITFHLSQLKHFTIIQAPLTFRAQRYDKHEIPHNSRTSFNSTPQPTNRSSRNAFYQPTNISSTLLPSASAQPSPNTSTHHPPSASICPPSHVFGTAASFRAALSLELFPNPFFAPFLSSQILTASKVPYPKILPNKTLIRRYTRMLFGLSTQYNSHLHRILSSNATSSSNPPPNVESNSTQHSTLLHHQSHHKSLLQHKSPHATSLAIANHPSLFTYLINDKESNSLNANAVQDEHLSSFSLQIEPITAFATQLEPNPPGLRLLIRVKRKRLKPKPQTDTSKASFEMDNDNRIGMEIGSRRADLRASPITSLSPFLSSSNSLQPISSSHPTSPPPRASPTSTNILSLFAPYSPFHKFQTSVVSTMLFHRAPSDKAIEYTQIPIFSTFLLQRLSQQIPQFQQYLEHSYKLGREISFTSFQLIGIVTSLHSFATPQLPPTFQVQFQNATTPLQSLSLGHQRQTTRSTSDLYQNTLNSPDPSNLLHLPSQAPPNGNTRSNLALDFLDEASIYGFSPEFELPSCPPSIDHITADLHAHIHTSSPHPQQARPTHQSDHIPAIFNSAQFSFSLPSFPKPLIFTPPPSDFQPCNTLPSNTHLPTPFVSGAEINPTHPISAALKSNLCLKMDPTGSIPSSPPLQSQHATQFNPTVTGTLQLADLLSSTLLSSLPDPILTLLATHLPHVHPTSRSPEFNSTGTSSPPHHLTNTIHPDHPPTLHYDPIIDDLDGLILQLQKSPFSVSLLPLITSLHHSHSYTQSRPLSYAESTQGRLIDNNNDKVNDQKSERLSLLSRPTISQILHTLFSPSPQSARSFSSAITPTPRQATLNPHHTSLLSTFKQFLIQHTPYKANPTLFFTHLAAFLNPKSKLQPLKPQRLNSHSSNSIPLAVDGHFIENTPLSSNNDGAENNPEINQPACEQEPLLALHDPYLHRISKPLTHDYQAIWPPIHYHLQLSSYLDQALADSAQARHSFPRLDNNITASSHSSSLSMGQKRNDNSPQSMLSPEFQAYPAPPHHIFSALSDPTIELTNPAEFSLLGPKFAKSIKIDEFYDIPDSTQGLLANSTNSVEFDPRNTEDEKKNDRSQPAPHAASQQAPTDYYTTLMTDAEINRLFFNDSDEEVFDGVKESQPPPPQPSQPSLDTIISTAQRFQMMATLIHIQLTTSILANETLELFLQYFAISSFRCCISCKHGPSVCKSSKTLQKLQKMVNDEFNSSVFTKIPQTLPLTSLCSPQIPTIPITADNSPFHQVLQLIFSIYYSTIYYYLIQTNSTATNPQSPLNFPPSPINHVSLFTAILQSTNRIFKLSSCGINRFEFETAYNPFFIPKRRLVKLKPGEITLPFWQCEYSPLLSSQSVAILTDLQSIPQSFMWDGPIEIQGAVDLNASDDDETALKQRSERDISPSMQSLPDDVHDISMVDELDLTGFSLYEDSFLDQSDSQQEQQFPMDDASDAQIDDSSDISHTSTPREPAAEIQANTDRKAAFNSAAQMFEDKSVVDFFSSKSGPSTFQSLSHNASLKWFPYDEDERLTLTALPISPPIPRIQGNIDVELDSRPTRVPPENQPTKVGDGLLSTSQNHHPFGLYFPQHLIIILQILSIDASSSLLSYPIFAHRSIDPYCYINGVKFQDTSIQLLENDLFDDDDSGTDEVRETPTEPISINAGQTKTTSGIDTATSMSLDDESGPFQGETKDVRVMYVTKHTNPLYLLPEKPSLYYLFLMSSSHTTSHLLYSLLLFPGQITPQNSQLDVSTSILAQFAAIFRSCLFAVKERLYFPLIIATLSSLMQCPVSTMPALLHKISSTASLSQPSPNPALAINTSANSPLISKISPQTIDLGFIAAQKVELVSYRRLLFFLGCTHYSSGPYKTLIVRPSLFPYTHYSSHRSSIVDDQIVMLITPPLEALLQTPSKSPQNAAPCLHTSSPTADLIGELLPMFQQTGQLYHHLYNKFNTQINLLVSFSYTSLFTSFSTFSPDLFQLPTQQIKTGIHLPQHWTWFIYNSHFSRLLSSLSQPTPSTTPLSLLPHIINPPSQPLQSALLLSTILHSHFPLQHHNHNLHHPSTLPPSCGHPSTHVLFSPITLTLPYSNFASILRSPTLTLPPSSSSVTKTLQFQYQPISAPTIEAHIRNLMQSAVILSLFQLTFSITLCPLWLLDKCIHTLKHPSFSLAMHSTMTSSAPLDHSTNSSLAPSFSDQISQTFALLSADQIKETLQLIFLSIFKQYSIIYLLQLSPHPVVLAGCDIIALVQSIPGAFEHVELMIQTDFTNLTAFDITVPLSIISTVHHDSNDVDNFLSSGINQLIEMLESIKHSYLKQGSCDAFTCQKPDTSNYLSDPEIQFQSPYPLPVQRSTKTQLYTFNPLIIHPILLAHLHNHCTLSTSSILSTSFKWSDKELLFKLIPSFLSHPLLATLTTTPSTTSVHFSSVTNWTSMHMYRLAQLFTRQLFLQQLFEFTPIFLYPVLIALFKISIDKPLALVNPSIRNPQERALLSMPLDTLAPISKFLYSTALYPPPVTALQSNMLPLVQSVLEYLPRHASLVSIAHKAPTFIPNSPSLSIFTQIQPHPLCQLLEPFAGLYIDASIFHQDRSASYQNFIAAALQFKRHQNSDISPPQHTSLTLNSLPQLSQEKVGLLNLLTAAFQLEISADSQLVNSICPSYSTAFSMVEAETPQESLTTQFMHCLGHSMTFSFPYMTISPELLYFSPKSIIEDAVGRQKTTPAAKAGTDGTNQATDAQSSTPSMHSIDQTTFSGLLQHTTYPINDKSQNTHHHTTFSLPTPQHLNTSVSSLFVDAGLILSPTLLKSLHQAFFDPNFASTETTPTSRSTPLPTTSLTAETSPSPQSPTTIPPLSFHQILTNVTHLCKLFHIPLSLALSSILLPQRWLFQCRTSFRQHCIDVRKSRQIKTLRLDLQLELQQNELRKHATKHKKKSKHLDQPQISRSSSLRSSSRTTSPLDMFYATVADNEDGDLGVNQDDANMQFEVELDIDSQSDPDDSLSTFSTSHTSLTVDQRATSSKKHTGHLKPTLALVRYYFLQSAHDEYREYVRQAEEFQANRSQYFRQTVPTPPFTHASLVPTTVKYAGRTIKISEPPKQPSILSPFAFLSGAANIITARFLDWKKRKSLAKPKHSISADTNRLYPRFFPRQIRGKMQRTTLAKTVSKKRRPTTSRRVASQPAAQQPQ